MAAFEWGLSKWDIDKAAESLNKDLFGKKKMKEKVLIPDNKIFTKDSVAIQDSDDEQFSKKAKKRLKERNRKKKKKVGETKSAGTNNLNENNTKIEIKRKQTVTKDKSSDEKTEKKKRRKSDSSQESSSNDTHSGKVNKIHNKKRKIKESREEKRSSRKNERDATLLLETNEKAKKRKRPESEIVDKDKLMFKKRKILDNVEENLGELQKKKRKRPNRKKKNNSKKNKYKHLALNSKNKTDTGNEILNGDTKKLTPESEPLKITSVDVLKTDNMNISNFPKEADDSCKQKEKKKKTKKLNKVVDSPSQGVIENINQSEYLSPDSKKDRYKGHEMDFKKRKENDKTHHRINKQKLLNMLENSSSDPIDQSALSMADDSSPKENKKKNRKRKRSLGENNSNEENVEDNKPSTSSGSGSITDPSFIKTPTKGLSNTAKELKDKATEKLKAARFRFINEQLYNCKGHEALQLFRKDMEAFKVYHQGFQSQTNRWPVNPLDAIIKHVNKRPKQLIVADFGCGDARLSESVPQKVHSFDLVALNDRVTVCDMSKTPLADDGIDIAVFCLSLMGTNLNDYILEANRVLKTGGLLKIAEVASRFHNPDQFIKHISSLGFLLLNRRELSDMFYLMDFKKVKRVKKSPFNVEIKLKSCVYKKR